MTSRNLPMTTFTSLIQAIIKTPLTHAYRWKEQDSVMCSMHDHQPVHTPYGMYRQLFHVLPPQYNKCQNLKATTQSKKRCK